MEEQKNESGLEAKQPENPTADLYAAATIEALKQRDALQKQLDEANAANKILLNSGINGVIPTEIVQEEPKVDPKALLKRMATEQLSNREYIKCALEESTAIIDTVKEDSYDVRGEKI